MRYKKSEQIFEKIKKAKSILLACHINPDADCVASNLALYYILKKMGKKVAITTLHEIPESYGFFHQVGRIKKVTYENFNYDEFDLVVCLDSSWDRIVGEAASKKIPKPPIPSILIDHHKRSVHFADINLVDTSSLSTTQMLFYIFLDNNMKWDKNVTNALLGGLIADTGGFHYVVDQESWNVASTLIKMGGDYYDLTRKLLRTVDADILKYKSKVLSGFKVDKNKKYAWAVITYEDYEKFGKPQLIKESVIDELKTLKGIKLCFVALEKQKSTLISVSLRTQDKSVDLSKLVTEFENGGGHPGAAATAFYNVELNKTIGIVREKVEKYLKENK